MELLKGRKKFILFFLLLFVFLFLGGVIVIDYIFMGLFILFMNLENVPLLRGHFCDQAVGVSKEK